MMVRRGSADEQAGSQDRQVQGCAGALKQPDLGDHGLEPLKAQFTYVVLGHLSTGSSQSGPHQRIRSPDWHKLAGLGAIDRAGNDGSGMRHDVICRCYRECENPAPADGP